MTSLTSEESVKRLATLTLEEKAQLEKLQKQLQDFEAQNPREQANNLIRQSRRLQLLIDRLKNIDHLLTEEAVTEVFEAQRNVAQKQQVADNLRKTALPPEVMNGTGSTQWKAMWLAAGKYSLEKVYLNQSFPFTDEGSKCVLCQQDLEEEARERLKHFQEFVVSEAENELRDAQATFNRLNQALSSLSIFDNSIEYIIQELESDSETLANELKTNLQQATERHAAICDLLQKNKEPSSPLPPYGSFGAKIQQHSTELNHRADSLLQQVNAEEKQRIEKDFRELKSRETLGAHIEIVLREIERKKQIAAYQLCLNDAKTRNITRKSTEVTKNVVTQRLKNSFDTELKNLRFHHAEVVLQEAGGERGALYHKLILKRAPNIEVPKVVSEGEARCLSIAAFFAELSTADDPSAILFDDPVSSLDHKWRSSVAERLVREAEERQVVIFTHDISFLFALHEYAEKLSIPIHNQHLRREQLGSGVSSPELPWLAMNVAKRIGVLKNKLQTVKKLHRQGHSLECEMNIKNIYSLLRATWERAIEQVLLNGTVERFRQSIETRRLLKLSDISNEDCQQIEAGMTKCSKWTDAHDSVPAMNEPIPEPDELEQDIHALEKWVKEVNKRRK